MFWLDIDTLHFSAITARVAYLVVFLVSALRQPRQVYLWHWIGALLGSTAGSILMLMRPPGDIMPVWLAVPVYLTYGTSLSFSWSGLRHFHGRRVDKGRFALLSILPAASYVATMAVGAEPRMALGSVFLFCLLSTLAVVREGLRNSPGDRLWAQYVVVAALGFYALLLLSSTIIAVFTDLPLNQDSSARVSLAIDQGAGVLIYFGFLAMAGERANLRLSRLAETDPLTGLSNRRGLAARLSREWPALGNGAGVLIADIDHFKSINDRHGHAAGDAILQAFSRRFENLVPGRAIPVRWGGEEFLTVFPAAGLDDMIALGERLRAATEAEPFVIPGTSIPLTVSIGVAAVQAGETSIEPATSRADAALYIAKASGRNRVCRNEGLGGPATGAPRSEPGPVGLAALTG